MNTLVDDLAALAGRDPALSASLAGIDGLSELLRWAAREDLPAVDLEIIAQDEFTHDAILAWKEKYLVFGLT